MKLSKEDVEKIAHLARLKLSPEEVERLSNELTSILDYVEVIKELDVTGVVETSQVTGLSNVTRPDVVTQDLCTPDELLNCSPLPKKDHQIRIKRMM